MRMPRRNAGKCAVLFAGFLLLLESSCAKSVPIPKADYRAADPAEKATYWLTTRGEHIYEFERFAVTDSTLIIIEVKSHGSHAPLFDMGKVETPVVIPWDDVVSFERRERSNLRTALAISAGVILVGGVVAVAVVAAALSGLGSLN